MIIYPISIDLLYLKFNESPEIIHELNKENPTGFNRQKYITLAIFTSSLSYSAYNFSDKHIVLYISSIEFITIYRFNRDAFSYTENIFC